MRRHRARSQRGSAALEFGLVAPVILLFLFGIIQYGYVFWSLETGSATAREAARRLIVGTDLVCTVAEARSQAGMPAVGATPPSVTPEYYDTHGNLSAGPVVGGIVKVTVSFQSLDMNLPLLPVPADGVVTQSAEARVENLPAVPLPCS